MQSLFKVDFAKLLLCVLNICSFACGVNFLVRPMNITFDIGSSFTLPCSADSDTIVEWHKGENDGIIIFTTVNGNAAVKNPDYEWERPNDRTVNLVVHNATSKFADLYCCHLENDVTGGPKACVYVKENITVLPSSEPSSIGPSSTQSVSGSDHILDFELAIGFVVLLGTAVQLSFNL